MILKIDTTLELKQLEPSDSVDIFNTINSEREYLSKWLPFIEYTNELSDTEKFVDSVVNAPKDRFEYVFAIKKSNNFVGLIGFKNTDHANKKTEIGYWLSKKYQKQGIMSRSLEKLCDFAFNNQGINRIQIRCAVDNISSIKLPKKLGFKFEGIERKGELLSGNVFTDLKVYSKIQTDN